MSGRDVMQTPAEQRRRRHGMMGELARQNYDPEDVWHETLLMAWRDRNAFEWRGLSSFRRWLLEIARTFCWWVGGGCGPRPR
jgi:DNA-directed RNA polymerase specialized sigma24 family protein